MARRPAPVDPDRLALLTGADEPRWHLDLRETPVGEDEEPDNVVAHLSGPEELERRGRRSPRPPADGGRHRPAAPPVASLPERLVDARWQPRWTAVLAVLAVLLAAGAVFGIRVAMARSAGAPQSVGRASGESTGSGADGAVRHGASDQGTEGGSATTAGQASGPAAAPAAVPTSVVVDVDGQVRRRGVVRLAAGARVVDALAAAGGPLPGADLAGLNQARVLTDGELVHVPRPGEAPPAAAPVGPGGVGAAAGAGAVAAPGAAPSVVDLNRATPEQLDALPGVGPAIAGRITQWRAEHGRFSSVDELGEVSGIGPKMLERLRPMVKV